MHARDFLCLFFGRPADEFHHVTGKDSDGNYLDRDFVAPLSRKPHDMEHTGRRQSPDIDDGVDGDPNVLRLKRTGHFLIRLGEHHTPGLVVLPAFFVVQLGLLLGLIADDLEEAE